MASPFNRSNQGPFRGQPPPNFKTNVNRNKTKKWVEAKGYTYDGDDWGEYDETDEYGVEQEQQEPVPPMPSQQQRVTGLRQAGQSAGPSNGGRNFTDPYGAPPQAIQRQQSFDVGDERRAFSSGVGQAPPSQLAGIPQGAPLHVDTEMPPDSVHRVNTGSSNYPSAGGLASSSDGTPYSANPSHRRDFSPSAMPPPLHPGMGPGDSQPGSDMAAASRGRPPRKSSLSQPASPVATDNQVPIEEETPRQRAPSNPTKPLPFIRPADIYKRMEEERARERASSQDSSRPSLDSLLRPNEELRGTPSKKSSSESLPSGQEERTGTPSSQRRQMLPTVTEGQPTTSGAPTVGDAGRQNFLPPSETSPSFSDEFEQFTSPQRHQPPAQAQADLQHQPSLGFRSVVEQAFDRPGAEAAAGASHSTGGSLRSTDPSDISRSNTDSTAGISPIMSRVPSVGAAAARGNHMQHESYDYNTTPTIAEEPAGSSRPTSVEGLPGPSTPKKLSPSHTRETSAESAFIPGYRRQDTPPSRGSPARTAAVEQGRITPEPQVAYMAASSGPDASRDVEHVPDVSTRSATAGLSEAPLAASAAQAIPPRSDSPTKSRSQSPSKSRVSQLAGRFDDIADANARRNSSHSVTSRQSWEVDSRKSWAEGPEQLQVPQRGQSPVPDPTLRPKLPGQWESFATEQPDNELAAPKVSNAAISADRAAETELEPTTTKSALRSDDVHDEAPSITQNPVAALTAAGAAIGASLMSSVGMSNETAKEAEPSETDQARDIEHPHGRLAVGDIVGRPGAMRAQSTLSDNSSVPPTPPPKDHDPINPPVPLKGQAYAPAAGTSAQNRFSADQIRSSLGASRGVDDSSDDGEDDENDRLRRDIVRSLSPEKDQEEITQGPSDVPGNRESNLLPSEYGDYWEGSTPEGSRYSRAPGDVSVGPQGVELTRPDPISEETPPAQKLSTNRPNFLDNRFSWEQNRNSIGFSQFTGLGASETAASSSELAAPSHLRQVSDGSDAPQVVEPSEPVAEPSLTVDDLPKQPSEDSSPPPTGLHIVNVRGAEEAVDLPPRLKTPEPQEARASRDGASSIGAPAASLNQADPVEASRETIAEQDFGSPPQPAADAAPALSLAPSLAPAPEISSGPADGSKPRPFRELAAIPNPRDRIKAYDTTREQFANTDTGLQGWLSQTIAANPEHGHLLKGGRPFPIDTRTTTVGARPGHRTSPSMTKFSNMLSPNTPQQTQSPDTIRPTQGSSPGASNNPSGNNSIGAQKGKELLQNAGVLGGKVGQGAKGLFAKGRSKFRAASGSDKVSTPTPIATSASSDATPSPPPQTLSRASTQPLEQTRSIAQPTPTRPRSSHFRRFSSRPSSMAVSEAGTIPEVPSEPLPSSSRRSTPDNRSTGSGISLSKRRMSPFRRRSSRPGSAVTLEEMAAVPEIPKEPLPVPTHQRSATFGGMFAGMRSNKDDEEKSKLKGFRRLSAFRRNSKPDAGLPSKTAQDDFFPGGFPKGLSYSGDRRASYAFGSTIPMPPATVLEQRRASVAVGAARSVLPPAPDIWGGPEQLADLQEKRPPSQLGILPSPTRDSFGISRDEVSPTADDDQTPRATHFDPNETALKNHLADYIPSPIDSEPDFRPPFRRHTSKGSDEQDSEARHSRLIESIVRHASPALKDIESRRQSRVGIEPDAVHLPLPNMGSVSGAPSPNMEKSDPLAGKISTPVTPIEKVAPPVLPKVEIPKSYSVKEGKMPAREEMMPSPEPPLPPAGAGVIPTSPVDQAEEVKQAATLDRNLSTTSKVSEAVSALEASPERHSEEHKGAIVSPLVSRAISNASVRPGLNEVLEQRSPVSRELSQMSKNSRPDISPISDEDREARATLGPIQAVTYGERKADWLDSDDEDMETPMERTQPRVQSSVPVPYGQMDKEITIEPLSRASTEDGWDKVSRTETPRGDGTETREGWHTPAEELEHDDDDVEINEAGTASSGHIRQISDIAKLNRESLRVKAEAAAAIRASAGHEPLPGDAALLQQSGGQRQPALVVNTALTPPTLTEPDTAVRQTESGAEDEDLPPPVPPKSPGPAVPARQSPFSRQSTAPPLPQGSPSRDHLQRPSFGESRPLSFQMLPRPASGSVPQEQINIIQSQAYPPPQPPAMISPTRARPPIPQQRDYSHEPDSAQSQGSPGGDVSRGAGLRRTSGPVQPPPPSEHVRQKSFDRLSQSMQPAGTFPLQSNAGSSRSVNAERFENHESAQGQFQQPSGGPPQSQVRDSRALPVGFLKGMSKPPGGPLDQQQQGNRSPQATSPQDPRMSAYQPSGYRNEGPDDRRVKKSGFFGSLRPTSSGAETALTIDSTQAQPSTSPVKTTKIHYLSDIERQQSQASANTKLSKADRRIERAQSSGELTGGKKKRFSSLTGLFGRSGTTGHAPPSRSSGSGRKLQKISEQKTPSPAQGHAIAPPPMPQQLRQPPQHPLERSRTGPASAYQEQTGSQPSADFQIPPGGFYAPENNGFGPGPGSGPQSPVSYGQNAQPTLPNVTESRAAIYLNGGQHSPPPHRWRPPQPSPPAEPLYQPPQRHMSAATYGQSPMQSGPMYGSPNSYTPSPPPARHASAPSHSQIYGHLRPQHAPRMPSVGEDGRHQERPWAIQLPSGPPDPENDAHRRDSIQYAMMVRQQMAQQQTMLAQQSPQAAYQAQQVQYMPAPQSQTFHGHGQPPYDTVTYPTQGGHHPRYSEIRDSQAPVLTLDPAAIARIKLEAQERARQRDQEAAQRFQQQQAEEIALRQRPYTAPDDENSLYAPPTRPQTALSPQQSSPLPPLPSQYMYPPPQQQQQSGGYDQRSYLQYPGRDGNDAQHYPLPTSPIGAIASPINPAAGQMAFPPLPTMPTMQQPQPGARSPHDPDSKAVGFGAHRAYPSEASIVAPPPPYHSPRASADEQMHVPNETLLRTERRTEELRGQIQARRQGEEGPSSSQRQPQTNRSRVDDDEPVVMHAASYPGMEWEPRWEE